ncbi:MAG: nucleoside phosphorylase [Roseburia sp.]|nr:nucleoside phosphorylase [Roseburia sp.]
MALMAHIKLEDTNTVKNALLPGDPARLDRIAVHLEQVEELACNREFRTIKGIYQGCAVLAVSTGIGGAGTAIVVEELAAIGVKNMIRIGSCGALQKGIRVGDLVLVHGAVRDEGTSKAYVDAAYPAVADFSLLGACREAAEAAQIPYHIGLARSHDSFYIDEKDEIYSYWQKKGILASDMETAGLYVAGRLRGVRCASILNVVVGCEEELQAQINRYTDGEDMAARGERREILTALNALRYIDKP